MTVPARLIVLARHAARVEPGPVRADAPSQCRVALHAVALRVAAGAALEPLSCRLAVLEKPERLRIVKGDVAAAGRSRAVRLVAILAEHLGVVAARAVALTTIRLGRVPDDEVRWMESALALASMAIAAEFA